MSSMTLDAGQVRVAGGHPDIPGLKGISSGQYRAFRLQKALREAGLDAHADSHRGNGPGGWVWTVQLDAAWLVDLVCAVSRMPITRVRPSRTGRSHLANAGWASAHPDDDSWRTRVLRRLTTGSKGFHGQPAANRSSSWWGDDRPVRGRWLVQAHAIWMLSPEHLDTWLETVPPARMPRATPLQQCTSVW